MPFPVTSAQAEQLAGPLTEHKIPYVLRSPEHGFYCRWSYLFHPFPTSLPLKEGLGVAQPTPLRVYFPDDSVPFHILVSHFLFPKIPDIQCSCGSLSLSLSLPLSSASTALSSCKQGLNTQQKHLWSRKIMM